MTERAEWSDLHDAVLEGVDLDWKSGAVQLRLRLCGPPEGGVWTIRAVGIRRLDVPRTQSWGPSVSVLEARFSSADDGERLELEMQSGDTIVVQASRIAVPERPNG